MIRQSCFIRYFLAGFMIYTGLLYSQNRTSEDRVKSLFIYGFSKYVEWPGQYNFNYFTIAVLGEDSALVKELNNIANTKNYYNKPFIIKSFPSTQEINDCQILYVNKKSGIALQDIFNAIGGKPILIVSEDYPFYTSMINFITIDNLQRFEINETKIQKQGLKISKELLSLSTTMEEWQNHYNSIQNKLLREKEQSEIQKKEIDNLKSIQETQKYEIEKAKVELAKQEMDLYNQKIQLESFLRENETQQKLLKEKVKILAAKDKEIKQRTKKMKEQELNVLYQNEILSRQIKQINLQESKIKTQEHVMQDNEAKIKSKQTSLNISLGILSVIAVAASITYKSLHDKKKANKILEEKNWAIEAQKKQIEEKNQAILSSINYAKKIQEAILPSEEDLSRYLPEHFIYSQPKDIVSGDFYWAHQSVDQQKVIFAVADCTGHGVPGAFMSLIGHSLLNELVVEDNMTDSSEILNELRHSIIDALKQKGSNEEAKDGMDIALCVWDKSKQIIEYSGAHNPLYLIRQGVLHEYKGDLQGIGFNRYPTKPFTKHTLSVQKGDSLYLFSDGFVDQKGGAEGKKFLYKQFRDLLIKISHLPMNEQSLKIQKTFLDWKGHYPQLDDVCILGLKLDV